MKWIIGLGFALTFGGPALASDLPNYLGNLRGSALSSLTVWDGFAFQSGSVGTCTRTDASVLTSYTCAIDGVQAIVNGANGRTLSVTMNKLVAQYVSPSLSPQYRRFIFTGSWTEGALHSAVRLMLWHYVSSPNEIHGTIELSDLGISSSIVAAPASR